MEEEAYKRNRKLSPFFPFPFLWRCEREGICNEDDARLSPPSIGSKMNQLSARAKSPFFFPVQSSQIREEMSFPALLFDNRENKIQPRALG